MKKTNKNKMDRCTLCGRPVKDLMQLYRDREERTNARNKRISDHAKQWRNDFNEEERASYLKIHNEMLNTPA